MATARVTLSQRMSQVIRSLLYDMNIYTHLANHNLRDEHLEPHDKRQHIPVSSTCRVSCGVSCITKDGYEWPQDGVTFPVGITIGSLVPPLVSVGFQGVEEGVEGRYRIMPRL